MKPIAVIVSFLILALSAGLRGMQCGVETVGAEKCCCEQMPHERDGGGNGTQSCPFCLSQTCPGFASAHEEPLRATLQAIGHPAAQFIRHDYPMPLIRAVWQPPRHA